MKNEKRKKKKEKRKKKKEKRKKKKEYDKLLIEQQYRKCDNYFLNDKMNIKITL